MNKTLKLLSILCSTLSLSSQLYESASSDSTSISEINPEHEYVIETQDWVKVIDKTSGEEGWARLSELKDSLSSNGNINGHWTYRSISSSTEKSETMHYKPISDEDIQNHNKRINALHKHHQQMMDDFSKLWSHFDAFDDYEEITA